MTERGWGGSASEANRTPARFEIQSNGSSILPETKGANSDCFRRVIIAGWQQILCQDYQYFQEPGPNIVYPFLYLTT